ncbi:hypothetical protein Tco_0779118 [Tanacetum coccineum]
MVVLVAEHEDIADLGSNVGPTNNSGVKVSILSRFIINAESPEEYPLAHQMIHEDLLPEPDCLTKVELMFASVAPILTLDVRVFQILVGCASAPLSSSLGPWFDPAEFSSFYPHHLYVFEQDIYGLTYCSPSCAKNLFSTNSDSLLRKAIGFGLSVISVLADLQ